MLFRSVEMQFKSAAAISVTYTLLERCGFEPAGWFDKDDFRAIHEFSTPDSVYALGAAVSDMSREVLRNIERTVKTTIRRRNGYGERRPMNAICDTTAKSETLSVKGCKVKITYASADTDCLDAIQKLLQTTILRTAGHTAA